MRHYCIKDYEEKLNLEEALFRAKLEVAILTAIITKKPITLKSNCRFQKGLNFMKCCKCGIWKERTTRFFHPHSKGAKQFPSCDAGYERLNNSCRTCSQERYHARRQLPKSFITNLIRQYKKDGLTVKWFDATFAAQNGRGLITNAPMELVSNGTNSVGIHRLNNKEEHVPNNCFLELQNLNVSQHSAIPSLQEAWKEVFTFLVKQFQEPDDQIAHTAFMNEQLHMSGPDLGFSTTDLSSKEYSRKVRNYHLPTILRIAIRYHTKADIRDYSFQHIFENQTQLYQMTYKYAVKQLQVQNWKCYYTGIPLTIDNLWTRISFERQHNSPWHFTPSGELGRTVFICRLFNSARQLSRLKILQYLLTQIMVEVPSDVRQMVTSEIIPLLQIPEPTLKIPRKQKIPTYSRTRIMRENARKRRKLLESCSPFEQNIE